MKNILQTIKYFIPVLVFMAGFSTAHASLLNLKASSKDLDIFEQFYVDVALDPEGATVNGLEANINYSGNISFVRAEYGKSIIGPWLVAPRLGELNSIDLAGIIPAGFAGVIDPFHSSLKSPGFVARLVFEAKEPGVATVAVHSSSDTLNDGFGTTETPGSNSIAVPISNTQNPSLYKTTDNTNPEIRAEVTRDPNLFNNRYALIFSATDSGAGIKDVMIKEGSRPWKNIESPYLLEDQTRHSIITLQSSNWSGATVVTKIDPLPRKLVTPSNIIILAAILIFVFLILKKLYYAHKK
jgi:hypothetical protein